MDKTKRIEININEVGLGSFIVDGHDLSDITEGVNLVIEPGNVTQCYVSFSAHQVAMRGSADVHALVDDLKKN